MNTKSVATFAVVLALSLVSGTMTSQAIAAVPDSGSTDGCTTPSVGASEPQLNIAPLSATSSRDAWPIVSETVEKFSDVDGVSHTVTTTVRELENPSPSSVQASGVCTWEAGRDVTTSDMRCGGGCVTQWMRNVYDKYLKDFNARWQFKELHLWWTSSGPEMSTGSSHLVLDYRYVALCDDSQYSNYWSTDLVPYWYTPTSTYEYIWDLTNYPILFAGTGYPLRNSDTTPVYERGQYIADASTALVLTYMSP
jgi:hypothetical protein